MEGYLGELYIGKKYFFMLIVHVMSEYICVYVWA